MAGPVFFVATVFVLAFIATLLVELWRAGR
jgi:hypothetical protein